MSAISYQTKAWNNAVARLGVFSKRAFDLFASVLGLLFLSPAFALAAIVIKYSSPGPVFYRGLRAGRGGKLFNILKFRTMYETPESYAGPRITAGDDGRITPVGRWLRDTKLNELPQLWNVLKGEMSIVGPRPEDPQVADTWPDGIRKEILSMRPGITSPASVLYRNEEKLLQSASVMDKYLNNILPSKVRLDRLYVREHNFLGDLDIIFLTLLGLLPNIRKQDFPEQVLFWGPLARFTSRHFSWFLVDTLVAFLAVGAAGVLWRTAGPLDLGWGPAVLMAMGTGLFFGLVNAIFGLHRISWSQARPTDVVGLVVSGGVTALLLIAFSCLAPFWAGLPIGMWVLASVLAIAGFVVARYRLRVLTGLANFWLERRRMATPLGERVLVIGAGQMSQFTIHLLRQSPLFNTLRIVGLVDDDPRKAGLRISGYNVLGTALDIPKLVQQWDVGLLLLAIGDLPAKRSRDILANCRQSGARLVHIPNIHNLLSICLLGPQDANSKLVSADWNGHVPASVVLGWLFELETLAQSDNMLALDRLRLLRDELAAHLVNETEHE